MAEAATGGERTALLLAGGRSVRMGRDKAWLPWLGRPLWRVMAESLAAAGAGRLVVACRQAQDLVTVVEDWGRETGVATEVILDPEPQQVGELDGMLGAIWRGVRGRGAPILAVPVDMPLVGDGLLRRLWEQEVASSGSGVVWREPNGQPAAFPVLISTHMAGELEDALGQVAGQWSWRRWLRHWLDSGAACAMQAGDAEMAQLQNWNRPEDVPLG